MIGFHPISTAVKPLHIIAVSVMLVRNQQLLLGRKKKGVTAGLYSTPGGKLEVNESLIQCVVRETKEETGILLDPDFVIEKGYREHFRYGMHYFMFYYACYKFLGDPVNNEPDTFESWEYHPLKSIPANCTEPKELLETL